MKKPITFLFLFYIGLGIALSQEMNVKNCAFFMQKGVTVQLNSVALENDGEVISDQNSTLVVKSDYSPVYLSGASTTLLGNLLISGQCKLESNISLARNLYMQKGRLDLSNSNLFLGGNLENECQDCYVSSEGMGALVKVFDMTSGEEISPGNLGLTFVPEESGLDLEIRRSHYTPLKYMEPGVKRVYTFSKAIRKQSAKFQYQEHESDHMDETNMHLWTLNDQEWSASKTQEHNQETNLISATEIPHGTTYALFKSPNEVDVSIPEAISPNGDGHNDAFIIENLNQYPNNKLIIFNEDSQILYESEPYENDWEGTTSKTFIPTNNQYLKNGTYFYIFIYDTSNPEKAQKGFVEIRR